MRSQKKTRKTNSRNSRVLRTNDSKRLSHRSMSQDSPSGREPRLGVDQGSADEFLLQGLHQDGELDVDFSKLSKKQLELIEEDGYLAHINTIVRQKFGSVRSKAEPKNSGTVRHKTTRRGQEKRGRQFKEEENMVQNNKTITKRRRKTKNGDVKGEANFYFDIDTHPSMAHGRQGDLSGNSEHSIKDEQMLKVHTHPKKASRKQKPRDAPETGVEGISGAVQNELEPAANWQQIHSRHSAGAKQRDSRLERRLNDQMVAFTAFVKPHHTELLCAELCMHRINDTVVGIWPNASVRMFGSSSTNLATFDSDLDLCVDNWQTSPFSPTKPQVRKALRQLAKALNRSGFCQQLAVRPHARVPVITFTDKITGLDVDLCMDAEITSVARESHKRQTARSNRLFERVSESFPQFRPMVMLLKLLLSQLSLNKTFKGGIGSFKLYCMVAHYLAINDVDEKDGVGTCLLGFFDHYGGPLEDKKKRREDRRKAAKAWNGNWSIKRPQLEPKRKATLTQDSRIELLHSHFGRSTSRSSADDQENRIIVEFGDVHMIKTCLRAFRAAASALRDVFPTLIPNAAEDVLVSSKNGASDLQRTLEKVGVCIDKAKYSPNPDMSYKFLLNELNLVSRVINPRLLAEQRMEKAHRSFSAQQTLTTLRSASADVEACLSSEHSESGDLSQDSTNAHKKTNWTSKLENRDCKFDVKVTHDERGPDSESEDEDFVGYFDEEDDSTSGEQATGGMGEDIQLNLL